MSAFIVNKVHVDYLISAAIQWGLVHGREADAVGAEVWAENVRSVSACYPDCEGDDLPGPCPTPDPARYEFASPKLAVEPFQVLQAIACFSYQSCEHREWEASGAREFLRALEAAAVERLPEEAKGTRWSPEYQTYVPRYKDRPEYARAQWEIR